MRGIHRSPVNSLHKGQWRRALKLSLISAWTNSWTKNGDAGDLRRHGADYDVIVDSSLRFTWYLILFQAASTDRPFSISSYTPSNMINLLRPSDLYMRHLTMPSLVQTMACRLLRAEPLFEPMLDYCILEPEKQTSEFLSEIHTFSFKKMHLQMSSAKWRQFCLGLNVLKQSHHRV